MSGYQQVALYVSGCVGLKQGHGIDHLGSSIANSLLPSVEFMVVICD